MKINKVLFFLSILILVNACKGTGKKNLPQEESQELAKGIRNDSLFEGLYFGMTEQDFFNHCWRMNKKGIFTEGGGQTVEYQLGKRNFLHPIQMNFYPRYKNLKINELPVKFTYKGIDLSFPNSQTEKLLNDVKKLMEEWYGKDFFITPYPEAMSGKAYAQVNGNRRIMIMVEKEYEVMVVFTDLTTRE